MRLNLLPHLPVELSVLREMHASFHKPISQHAASRERKWLVEAIADTGAQTCACGPEIIHALGLSEKDLVPTSHCINGVTTTAMDIGVIFASICTKGAMTRQAIYVGNNIKGLFPLS